MQVYQNQILEISSKGLTADEKEFTFVMNKSLENLLLQKVQVIVLERMAKNC